MFKWLFTWVHLIVLINLINGIYLADASQDLESQNIAKRFPVNVALLDKKGIGSGVLIDSDWIVTSAHINPSVAIIDGKVREFNLSIAHPLYGCDVYNILENLGSPKFDIRLLHLQKTVSIRPIERARNQINDMLMQGAVRVWLLGLGTTNSGLEQDIYRAASNTLKPLNIYFKKPDKTWKFLRTENNRDSSIAGYMWQGDSGGGNFVNIEDPESSSPPENEDDFYNKFKLFGLNTTFFGCNQEQQNMLINSNFISIDETRKDMSAIRIEPLNYKDIKNVCTVSLNLSSKKLGSWIDKMILTESLNTLTKDIKLKDLLTIDRNKTELINCTDSEVDQVRQPVGILIDPKWVLISGYGLIKEGAVPNIPSSIMIKGLEYNVDIEKCIFDQNIHFIKLKESVQHFKPVLRARLTKAEMHLLKDYQDSIEAKMGMTTLGYVFDMRDDNKKIFAIPQELTPYPLKGSTFQQLLFLTPERMAAMDHMILSDALKSP